MSIKNGGLDQYVSERLTLMQGLKWLTIVWSVFSDYAERVITCNIGSKQAAGIHAVYFKTKQDKRLL